MFRLSAEVDYGPDMDEECRSLCDALNSVKGIQTSESCCGHGERPFHVWFKVTDMKGLFFVTRCVDRRYWKQGHEWGITLHVGDTIEDGILPTGFLLGSEKVGEEAYRQAASLVENLNHHLNHEAFKRLFGFDICDFVAEPL